MRKAILAAAMMFAATGAASAFDYNSYELANALGGVLADETFCGLTYDQDAIKAYIEKTVAADNMDFGEQLKSAITSGHIHQERMTDSEKNATCTQTSRVAKNYGFVK